MPDFQNVNLATKRTKIEAGVMVEASEKVDIPVSYSYEHKTGLKALGAVTSQVAENAVILPVPIDLDTSQANAAVNYKLKKFFLSFAYYGSFFNNNVTSMTWQDVADPTKTATMAKARATSSTSSRLLAAEKFKGNRSLWCWDLTGATRRTRPSLDPRRRRMGSWHLACPKHR